MFPVCPFDPPKGFEVSMTPYRKIEIIEII
jgi:hypothetical protein